MEIEIVVEEEKPEPDYVYVLGAEGICNDWGGKDLVEGDFKMEWLDFFRNYVNELRKKRPQLIISGDYNICHEAIDIHDPVRNAKSSGFLPEERQWFTDFLNDGYTDSFRLLNKEPNNYSWWSYRFNAKLNNKGWRIDYHILTDNLNEKLISASIMPEVNFSDHCPIVVEIKGTSINSPFK